MLNLRSLAGYAKISPRMSGGYINVFGVVQQLLTAGAIDRALAAGMRMMRSLEVEHSPFSYLVDHPLSSPKQFRKSRQSRNRLKRQRKSYLAGHLSTEPPSYPAAEQGEDKLPPYDVRSTFKTTLRTCKWRGSDVSDCLFSTVIPKMAPNSMTDQPKPHVMTCKCTRARMTAAD